MVSTLKDNSNMYKQEVGLSSNLLPGSDTMCLELPSIYEGSRIFIFFAYSSLQKSLV